MKIVIALKYEEFVHACHQRNWKHTVVPWIRTLSDIRKIQGPVEPVFIGHFWELPEYDDIVREMRARGIKVKGQYISRESV